MSPLIEFWSSVELGAFGRGLMRALAEAGFSATHRFAVGDAQYRHAAGRMGRAAMRWRSYVSYPLQLRARMNSAPRPDAVVVCTNTFYAPAVAAQAAARSGVPVVHWIFDLFPDVLAAEGGLAARGAVRQGLAQLTRWTFQHAAANVFLGDKLRTYAERQYGVVPHAHVIPVGADGSSFRDSAPGPRPPHHTVRVLYCGNFGRMHDTDTVMALLRETTTPPWHLEFRGHGAGFRRVATAVPAQSWVNFAGSLQDGEWTEAMKAADLALVTLKPGAEGLVMPSKTYSAMVAGQAILAVCPLDSELADTVRHHDAGWVVQPGRHAELASVLREAAARPDEVLRRRRNAHRAGHEHYAQTALTERWVTLLDSVIRSAKRGR